MATLTVTEPVRICVGAAQGLWFSSLPKGFYGSQVSSAHSAPPRETGFKGSISYLQDTHKVIIFVACSMPCYTVSHDCQFPA